MWLSFYFSCVSRAVDDRTRQTVCPLTVLCSTDVTKPPKTSAKLTTSAAYSNSISHFDITNLISYHITHTRLVNLI